MIVKGFQQQKIIDFTEIFSSVVKLTAIRCVLSIVTAEDMHLEQLDVKTALLRDNLEDDVAVGLNHARKGAVGLQAQ